MPSPAVRLKIPLFCVLFCLALLAAQAAPETNLVFIARAQTEFKQAQTAYQAYPRNATNAWQFACACFDLAEFATNDDARADLARQGIAAAKDLLTREPKSAPAHYYLAMNYGSLADALAPSLTSYRLVREVESEFKITVALDEPFDYAGAPRCLGLLYRDAPGWPVSIGSRRRAREYLERAAALFPEYPENQLNLAETFLQWHQRDEAEKSLKKLAAIWTPAQTRLTGELWEKPWRDWTNRRAAAWAVLEKQSGRVPGS